MEIDVQRSCTYCRGTLKKQKLGLNIIYYCPKCGCMTSAISV